MNINSQLIEAEKQVIENYEYNDKHNLYIGKEGYRTTVVVTDMGNGLTAEARVAGNNVRLHARTTFKMNGKRVSAEVAAEIMAKAAA